MSARTNKSLDDHQRLCNSPRRLKRLQGARMVQSERAADGGGKRYPTPLRITSLTSYPR